jgi:hypothetical protein
LFEDSEEKYEKLVGIEGIQPRTSVWTLFGEFGRIRKKAVQAYLKALTLNSWG